MSVISPYLYQYTTPLLGKSVVISHFHYSNALQAGLPSRTVKALQMVQNVEAHLVFDHPKRALVTLLVIGLH